MDKSRFVLIVAMGSLCFAPANARTYLPPPGYVPPSENVVYETTHPTPPTPLAPQAIDEAHKLKPIPQSTTYKEVPTAPIPAAAPVYPTTAPVYERNEPAVKPYIPLPASTSLNNNGVVSSEKALNYAPKKPVSKDIFRLYGGGGVSSASLNWNIGLSPSTPNILSELTWQNLKSYMITSGFEYECVGGWCNRLMVLGNLYGNSAYDGDNQDSDYFFNNRVGEFSRSNNNADDSKFRGGTIGIGYNLRTGSAKNNVSLIPMIGYTYDVQDLRMTDGFQTVPATGPFPGLNSRYKTSWKGGYAGAELRALFYGRHELRTRATITSSDYKGTGTWNLRDDFAQPDSYEHFADGFGRIYSAGYSFFITPKWELRLDGKYEFWKAGEGRDVTYFADGSNSTIRFNEVKYKAHSYTMEVGYKF